MWEKIKSLKNKKLLISSLGALGFISFLTAAGGVFGYLLTKWGSGKKTGVSGRIKSLRLKIGNYYLHLHHWLLGSFLLVLGIFDFFSFLNAAFFQGFVFGLIFQGIFDYHDWHKIIIKKAP